MVSFWSAGNAKAGVPFPADSARSLSVPGKAPVCAPQTGVFISLYRMPDAALDRIFADKDERVILMRAKSFTILYAREELAKLGHTSPDSLSLVHAVIRFSGGSGPWTYRTPGGSGYLVAAGRLDHKNRVTICELAPGPEMSARADEILRPSDLLLVKLSIGGVPYVMAAYSPYYDPETFNRDAGPAQASFLQSARGTIRKDLWIPLQRDSIAVADCLPQ